MQLAAPFAMLDEPPAAEARDVAVAVRNLTKRFGAQQVLNGVDLEVCRGEFVSILGPSGCGKTTLLQIVAGLLPLDGGQIVIGGRQVAGTGLNVPPERRSLGMVFQDYALWPHMTAREQVAFPLRMRKEAAVDTKAEQLLAQVGLAALGDRLPAQLSGGQQQRVGLARALAGSPLALLLDEPLSNLDAQLREQMRDEVRSACGQAGVACLYVTHDQTEALALSDRVAVMSGGQILQDAPPQEVFRRPRSARVAHIVGAGEVLPGRFAGGAFRPEGLDVPLHAGRHPELAEGARAALVVHSSRIALSCEPASINSVAVVVAGCAFLGDRWQIQCRLPNGSVLKANSDRAWPPGEPIWCSFAPDQAFITTLEEHQA